MAEYMSEAGLIITQILEIYLAITAEYVASSTLVPERPDGPQVAHRIAVLKTGETPSFLGKEMITIPGSCSCPRRTW